MFAYKSIIKTQYNSETTSLTERQKAWYCPHNSEKNKFYPVVVLSPSPTKTIVSDGIDSFQVQDSNLFPRSQTEELQNLCELENVNQPQIFHYLVTPSYQKAHQQKKIFRFIKLTHNILIDKMPLDLIENSAPLRRFYFEHIHYFLSSFHLKQETIFNYGENTKHKYLGAVFEVLQDSYEFWPYKGKIQALSKILSLLLNLVTLEVKFGFNTQNHSRKLKIIHIKPFLFGLVSIPPHILKIFSNKKCQNLYRMPISKKQSKDEAQLFQISEAFLSLGFNPTQIHEIFKIISVIANCQQLYIEKFTISGKQYYRITGKDSVLENLCHLLQVSDEQLTRKILYGEQVVEKGYCNDGEIAKKRLQIFNIIFYEMFVVDLCSKINLKLKGEHNLFEEIHNINKWLIVTSIDVNKTEVSGMIGKHMQDFFGQRMIQLFNMNKLSREQKNYEYFNYGSLLESKRKKILTEPYNSDAVAEEFKFLKMYEEIINYEMITNISINLFNKFLKLQIVHEPPSTLDLEHKECKYIISNDLVFSDYHQTPYSYLFSQQIPSGYFIDNIIEYINGYKINDEESKYNVKLEEFVQRYKYTKEMKQVHRDFTKKIFSYFLQKELDKKLEEEVWEYFTRTEQNWINLFPLQQPNSKTNIKKIAQTKYFVQIDNESFVKLEEQVKNQQRIVKRIFRQYKISKRRKLTQKLVHKIFIEKKMEKLLQKIILNQKKKVLRSVKHYISLRDIYFLTRKKILQKKTDGFSFLRYTASLKTTKKVFLQVQKRRKLEGFNKMKQKYEKIKLFSHTIILIENIHKRQKFQKSKFSWGQLMKEKSKLSVPMMEKVTDNSKKSNYKFKYIEPEQNLKELSIEEMKKIQDSPDFSLQKWQNSSILKSSASGELIKLLFLRYETITQKMKHQVKIEHPNYVLKPDDFFSQQIQSNRFLKFCKTYVKRTDDQDLKYIIKYQYKLINFPVMNNYPIKQYPTAFSESFNCMLKIGGEKNSSKKLHDLLNILAQILNSSYNKDAKSVEDIFQDEPIIIPDYTSNHNILKDEIFMHFVKQMMNNLHPQSKQNVYKALNIFTRHYYPSPQFIYPFIEYIQVHNKEIKNKYNEETLQNLMRFVQAMEGNKGNELKVFEGEKYKSEVESAGIMFYRKTPFSEAQMKQKLQVRIRLLNNQSFTFIIRNQILKSFKALILNQFGLKDKEKYFGLYIMKKNMAFQLISDKQKAIDFVNSPLFEFPLYLKIKHYFPFRIREMNIVRLVYMNMVWDEKYFPWNPKQYEFIVALSMAYDEFEEIRTMNYLAMTNQNQAKKPDLKPVEEAYKKIQSQGLDKKICEYQYLRYMKEANFFIMNVYFAKESYTSVGVKPFEILIFEDIHRVSSIGMKRVRNVYMVGNAVILELMYKSEKPHQQLRTLAMPKMEKPHELFTDILHHIQIKK